MTGPELAVELTAAGFAFAGVVLLVAAHRLNRKPKKGPRHRA